MDKRARKSLWLAGLLVAGLCLAVTGATRSEGYTPRGYTRLLTPRARALAPEESPLTDCFMECSRLRARAGDGVIPKQAFETLRRLCRLAADVERRKEGKEGREKMPPAAGRE